jgi:hypothetical protein
LEGRLSGAGRRLLAGREAAIRARQYLVVADAQRFDPSLLAERQSDEEAKFD